MYEDIIRQQHETGDSDEFKHHIRTQALIHFPNIKLYALQKGAVMMRERMLRVQAIDKAFGDVNPDTHVIVTKEQLDLTNQLKAFTALNSIADNIQQVNDKMNDLKPLKEDVQFIKGIYTTPAPEKKKVTVSKEEETAKIIAKLLKTPHRKA